MEHLGQFSISTWSRSGSIFGQRQHAWVFIEEDLVEYLRIQVRQQMRERSAETEVQMQFDKVVEHRAKMAPVKSPLAGRQKQKRVLPNLDLYD